MNDLLLPKHARQNVLYSEWADTRRNFEHALLKFRLFGARELIAELAEHSNQNLSRAGRVDVGQVKDCAFPRHSVDLVFDAERAFQIVQIVGEEEVALLRRNANYNRANRVAASEFRNASHHFDELAWIIICISSHLCFYHNNSCIDDFPRVLKARSRNCEISYHPREE